MKAALRRGPANRQLILRRIDAHTPSSTPVVAANEYYVRVFRPPSSSVSTLFGGGRWCHRHHHRSRTLNECSVVDGSATTILLTRSHLLARRYRSTTTTTVAAAAAAAATIEDTPLHGPRGAALLRGLDVHTVPADDDGHPLAVYAMGEKVPRDDDDDDDDDDGRRRRPPRMPVLLLHGRTWSSVPVYHLARRNDDDGEKIIDGETTNTNTISGAGGGEDRSLIRALHDTGRIRPYAMDFRGFGGTPKDGSGYAEPLKCVTDAITVLNWIHRREKEEEEERRRRRRWIDDDDEGGGGGGGGGTTMAAAAEEADIIRPALLGWSHGALIAQIIAQRHSDSLSKLILYGSTYNPNVRHSIPPPPAAGNVDDDDDDFPLHLMTARNEYDGAMEDFTSVGRGNGNGDGDDDDEARIFPPASARLFAEAALVSDPIKVKWHNLHQLNECHPSLVKVPTMVIAGDQDPYAPMLTQAELFTNLGRGVDRIWTIIANADHAVHLSDERHRFVENVDNFLEVR